MKTTLWILCSLLLLSPALAAPAGPLDEDSIRARIAASPSLKSAGDEEALVLFEGDYIDYADGRAVWRHQELIRLYSEYAIDHLGDPRLAWDASRQKLDIHANRTYLNDGSMQDAPANAHNEVTPFGGFDRAVDFIDIREMVVTRVGLERGVTVWLDYTIFDLEPGWLPFGRHFFFHGEFPVAERELIVRGLQGEVVNPDAAFGKIAPAEEIGGLLWRAKDLPPRPHDLNARTGDQLPWIAVYEFDAWKVPMEMLDAACKRSLADLGSLHSELEDLEDEHHPLGMEARLDMWMDWIDSRVTRVSHSLLPWSRPPRTVGECLNSATASDLERTLILYACCRSEDAAAKLYFPARWRSLKDAAPAVSALDSPGVFLHSMKGKPLHVDGPNWRVDARPEPRLMVSLETDTAASWHSLWKMDDRVEMKAYWNLETGEAKADISLFGPAAQYLGLNQPQDLLTDWAATWGEEAEASNITIRNLTPAILQGSLDIKADMPEADDDGFVLLTPPFPPLSPSDFRPAGINQALREVAWLPENTLSYDCEWELVLPEGWKVKLPQSTSDDFAKGSFSVSAAREGARIGLRYTLVWNEAPVSTSDWPSFRKSMLDALDTSILQLVLKESVE